MKPIEPREILFRGKRINDEFIEGYLAKRADSYFIAPNICRYSSYRLDSSSLGLFYEVASSTIGQYTGYDEFVFADRGKNKKIFEHDIVEVWAERRPYNWSERAITKNDTYIKARGVIVFRNGLWQIDFENNFNDRICEPKNGEKIKRCLHHWKQLSHYGWGEFHSEEYLAGYIKRNSRYKFNHLHDITVIGNIHDNTELLL